MPRTGASEILAVPNPRFSMSDAFKTTEAILRAFRQNEIGMESMSKVKVLVGQGSRNFAHNLDDLLERWQLRYAPDDLKKGKDLNMMDANAFSRYIRNAEVEHLLELSRDMQAMLADTKAYLSTHVFDPKLSDMDFAEKEQYLSAVRARKKCGGYLSVISSEIASRPKQVPQKPVSSILLDIIWDEEIVPREQFKELMKRAKKIYTDQAKSL
jgi:hypothetical protein